MTEQATLETLRQGTTLEAARAFTFKRNNKGRSILVQPGQRFWVTNSQLDQKANGFVTIDRAGRGCISHGYAFAHADIARLFKAV
mgnify:CR=1 FL=1